MKLDLHTHGKLARRLPFSWEYTKRQFDEAYAAGLDAICVTEHFNIPEFDALYEHIASELPREGDCYLYKQLKIFTGAEIEIAEGGHISVTGTVKDVMSLRGRHPFYTRGENFIPFEELIPSLTEYPFIIGMAHPFREGGHTPEQREDYLRKFSYVELNGKDASFDREGIKKRTYALGKRLGLPVAAGSDAHQALQFGCVYNDLETDCAAVEQLREAIASGGYKITIPADCEFKVKSAEMMKAAQKKIHALGGDYTDVFL